MDAYARNFFNCPFSTTTSSLASTTTTTTSTTKATTSTPTPTTPTAAALIHSYGTRNRQSVPRQPSSRVLANTNSYPSTTTPATLAPAATVFASPGAPQHLQQQRRIRPLAACASPITSRTPVANKAPDATHTLPHPRPLAKAAYDGQHAQEQDIQFPPDGVVLHPDDATSKVLTSIGRAFLSVVSPLSPLPFFIFRPSKFAFVAPPCLCRGASQRLPFLTCLFHS